MTISLKKSKGLLITALNKAAIIGTVSSAVLEKESNKVSGFKVNLGKPNTIGQEFWLASEQVKKIGQDMILVTSEAKLQAEPVQGLFIEQLIGMPVSSKDGRALGHVLDVNVNEKTWMIIGLLLDNHKEVILDTNELVIGTDMVLVQSGAEVKSNRPVKTEGPKLTVTISKDISKQTTKVVERGEALVKRTTDAMRKVLKGSEANLSNVRHKLKDKKSGHPIKSRTKKATTKKSTKTSK